MYICIYESMYESMNGDICVCMTSVYICIFAYMNQYMYTYLCIYIYIYIYESMNFIVCIYKHMYNTSMYLHSWCFLLVPIEYMFVLLVSDGMAYSHVDISTYA